MVKLSIDGEDVSVCEVEGGDDNLAMELMLFAFDPFQRYDEDMVSKNWIHDIVTHRINFGASTHGNPSRDVGAA